MRRCPRQGAGLSSAPLLGGDRGDSIQISVAEAGTTQFTCCTSTKVQILTPTYASACYLLYYEY